MRQKPPPEADERPQEAAAPEGALRPMPAHAGPFVPPGGLPEGLAVDRPAAFPDAPPAPGLVRAFGSADAPDPIAASARDIFGAAPGDPPPADLAALPTVEELAERHGLYAKDASGRETKRFLRNFLFAKEGWGQGQRVEPAAFEAALDEAQNTPLNGAPDPSRKRIRRAR